MMIKSYKVAATSTRGPTIEDLRAAVTKAEADGVSRDTMLLRLTFRDESLIKRSPEVGLDEVSFIDGEMRFVGVRVKVRIPPNRSLQGLCHAPPPGCPKPLP